MTILLFCLLLGSLAFASKESEGFKVSYGYHSKNEIRLQRQTIKRKQSWVLSFVADDPKLRPFRRVIPAETAKRLQNELVQLENQMGKRWARTPAETCRLSLGLQNNKTKSSKSFCFDSVPANLEKKWANWVNEVHSYGEETQVRRVR